VMITDAKLRYPGPKIIYVNHALCKITGYKKEEFIGKSPRILQGSRTDHIVLGEIRKKLPRGERFQEEVINYRKDGSELNMEIDIAPITDENNKISHYISIHRDVTPYIKKVEEKNQQLIVFSHDIKNILTTVKGYLQLIDKKNIDIKMKDYVQSSEQEVDKIIVLLSNLQNLRQNSNSMIKISKFDVDTLLAQAIKNVRNVCKTHKIARRGKVHQQLLIDANKISQVIENLIMNAANYAFDTSSIIVRVKKDIKANKVIISIEDVCKGLPSVEKEKILQIFNEQNTLDVESLTEKNGIYESPHITSEVVKAHGGIMNVRNDLGKGIIFSLSLPIGK
jgi:PAS domain S-box-containing protein